jgi:hypothetical protein
MYAANSSRLCCNGTMTLNVTFYDRTICLTFYVTPDVDGVILSWHALQQLDSIRHYFPRPIYLSENKIRVDAVHDGQVKSVTTEYEPSNDNDIDVIKKQFISSHSAIFDSSVLFKAMVGKPMHIYLNDIPDDKKPKPCLVSRPIPFAFRDSAKKELDDMVNKGIIRPVLEPTDFVSPFLVVGKPNGSVRLVVDYKGLNRFVRRPIHPFPSISDVKLAIPSTAQWFATLDATKGYWQVPLDPESQLLTTFLTPWCRFCYTRAPMDWRALAMSIVHAVIVLWKELSTRSRW